MRKRKIGKPAHQVDHVIPRCGLQAEPVRRYRRLQLARSRALRADDRQALEQLCRYITRPALANERAQTNAAGQVVLKLKTAWRDGTTHLVLRRDTNSPVDCLCQPKGPSSARAQPARQSPLEFLQRLAALVPRPRLHLIRLVSAQLRFWK